MQKTLLPVLRPVRYFFDLSVRFLVFVSERMTITDAVIISAPMVPARAKKIRDKNHPSAVELW